MNYFIYCLHTGRQTSELKTLKECKTELLHCAGFGIANNTTNQAVIVRGLSGFRPAKRFINNENFCTLVSRLKTHIWAH